MTPKNYRSRSIRDPHPTSWRQVSGKTPTVARATVFAWDSKRSVVWRFDGANAGEIWKWTGAVWTQVPTSGGPSPRASQNMAYDPIRDRLVLYGGTSGRQSLCDTWEFDGSVWRLATTNGPAGIGQMAFDANRGRIVILCSGALWDWDGALWRRVTNGAIPAVSLDGMALAYDAGRSRLVAFGGVDTNPPFGPVWHNETWEWTGTSWSRPQPATLPVARQDARLAYDARRRRMVLFGGINPFGPVRDLQEWDGATWRAIGTPGPAARTDFGCAYDAVRSVVVAGGGLGFSGALSDTWTWDGIRWQQPGPSAPRRRTCHALCFDELRGRVVLFGGAFFNDTWLWDGTTWQAATPPTVPPGVDLVLSDRRSFGARECSSVLMPHKYLCTSYLY